MYRILVLNFGGTSSKVSVYEDNKCICNHTIDHPANEVGNATTSREQLVLRKRQLLEWLDSIHIGIKDIDAYALRVGGVFYGGDGGTFLIEGALRDQILSQYIPDKPPVHATRLALPLVDELQEGLEQKRPCYTTDPSSVSQFLPEARLTGHPLFTKRAAFHPLNQRAVARRVAEHMGTTYDKINIVVAHCGGGVSVGAHEKGRIIDTNDSSGDGDGPFSPTRCGSLPTGQLMHLCFSGTYTEKEVYTMLKYEGGLKAYLGTEDLREVERRIDQGDQKAELVFKALAYQISREIGACCATLCGQVDAIALTGGMAKSKRLVDLIKERVGRMAPVYVYAGEFENEALALGAYRILSGQEKLTQYTGEHGHMLAYSI